MKENALAIRHLEDTDNLREGLDGGIIEGQEHIAEKLAQTIFDTAKESGAEHIDIITSDQKRTLETSTLIFNSLEKLQAHANSLVVDEKLRGLDQGTPHLPDNYTEGDEFPPLKTAWGPFWQHVKDGDIFYKFGQAEVENSVFEKSGESYADILYRHLEFVHQLLLEQEVNPNKLIVFVGHSMNIRIVKEIIAIAKEHDSILNPIPLGNIAHMMEEHWDKKRPGFGDLETVNVSALMTGLATDQIDQEIHMLRARMVQNQVRN